MLNQLVLVGRITYNPETIILEDGRKTLKFQIAVPRAFKNQEGVYDTDFVNVTTWEGLTVAVENYLTKGMLVAVKARVQSWQYDLGNDKKLNMLEVIAERISYLSSKNKTEEAEE